MPIEQLGASVHAAPKPNHLGRRALLGLTILSIMTAASAGLIYTTIEPEEIAQLDPDGAHRRALLAKVTSWSVRPQLDTAGGVDGLVLVNAGALVGLDVSAAQKLIESRADDATRPLVVAGLSIRQVGQLDELLARGLDGVFLDARAALRSAQAEGAGSIRNLADQIIRLANQARLYNPDFLLVLHNAAELASDVRVARMIDGAAQDNLLYGLDGVGIANSGTEVAASLHDLNRVKRSGRPVFVAEHLDATALAARTSARRKLAELGFIARIAEPMPPS